MHQKNCLILSHHLSRYDILIFDPAYNALNQFNEPGFDGTRFAGLGILRNADLPSLWVDKSATNSATVKPIDQLRSLDRSLKFVSATSTSLAGQLHRKMLSSGMQPTRGASCPRGYVRGGACRDLPLPATLVWF